VGDITSQYDDGLITQEERHEAVVEQWKRGGPTRSADADGSANLDTLKTPIFMMANSGAARLLQADPPAGGDAGGLMANPKGEIIERPIKANFMEGLSGARVLHLPRTARRKGPCRHAAAHGRLGIT